MNYKQKQYLKYLYMADIDKYIAQGTMSYNDLEKIASALCRAYFPSAPESLCLAFQAYAASRQDLFCARANIEYELKKFSYKEE